MAEELKRKEYLTTTQAAEILSVSPDTVLKWVKAGKIKSHRTLGGHFRIPARELELLSSGDVVVSGEEEAAISEAFHQYCWEYLAAGGSIKPECKDCITYRSRSMRCYELRDLPNGLGCLRIGCESSCDECHYFQLVREQETNVLVLTERKRLISDWKRLGKVADLRVRFARDVYECSMMIEKFRPDYIVVDCSFGKRKTGLVCENFFNDPRIPVARIILSSKTRDIGEYCSKDVFGWIKRPFTIQQLRDCIHGSLN